MVSERVQGLVGPRGCRPEEVPAVVELCNDVFSQEERQMGPEFPTLFRAENAEWLRTFWAGDRPVAHLGVWRATVRVPGRHLPVAHIGAVCTLPEYRGQGLGTDLVADALRRLRSAGTALLLISGGRGLYQRIGARPFGALLRYRVEPAVLDGIPLPEYRVETPPGPAVLARVQARESTRYERSLEDWELLLPAKGYLPTTRERGSLVALDGDEAESYLLLGPVRADAEGGPRLDVDEYGGEREGVLAALAVAMRAAGVAAATLRVLPGDVEMRRILEGAGLAAEIGHHQGTGRILDPAAFRPLNHWDPAPQLPPGPLGDPAEAEAAAALTERLLGPGGLELPRNDGLNYI